MALSTKVERFGQGSSTVLALKSDTRNKDYAVKATATDERGDIIARDLAGLRESPSAEYTVKASGNLSLSLGAVNTVSSTVYCLLGLNITTSAASAPKVTLSGESLQTGATVSSTIDLGDIALSVRHKAQILCAAFTLSGTGCKLTECSLDVKANLTRATVDGETLAHDVSGATFSVKGTVVQTGATVPTITAAEGWTLNTPTSEENPDEGHTTWTFELTKDLTSAEPA